MERSLGGCQYHVMHPGGRNYDRFPVNSYEAESRRLSRFSRLGAHAGPDDACRRPERSREFPVHARSAIADLTTRRPYDASASRLHRRRRRCSGLPGAAGHFDELTAATARCGRRWAAFAAHAGDLRAEHLARAQARVARQIHENGVTYNVYAAADGPSRPWTLDVLPLIVPGGEWERARARPAPARAAARTRWPPTSTVRSGCCATACMPPALVFRHPGFLRACHGVRPPGGVFLHLVAFDLARGARRRWRVVGTRDAGAVGRRLRAREPRDDLAPASRRVPRAAASQSLTPLLPRRCGRRCSPRRRPTVRRRTSCCSRPGPTTRPTSSTPTSRKQLGFPLVEGGDLTVRHDRVFLKTVSGLRRVHAHPAPARRRLLRSAGAARRFDARRARPRAGVARRARAGRQRVRHRRARVARSAALPAGRLRAAARRAARDAVARHVLVRRPRQRSAAPAAPAPRRHQAGASPASSMEPVFLADARRGRAPGVVAERLGADPDAYVVEEFLPLSHAPVWHTAAPREPRADAARVPASPTAAATTA